LYLAFSGRIGSEFLPHLDEGAIWARGTLAPSTGPTQGEAIMRQARIAFASFPEVTQVVSQVAAPTMAPTDGFLQHRILRRSAAARPVASGFRPRTRMP